MKIYLAGGVLEREEISKYMRKLEAIGYEITCDWTKSEGLVPGNTSDADLSDEDQKKFAIADLKGIDDAYFVWHIVASYKGSRGAYVEIGYALAKKKILIVSGPDARKTIFHSFAHHHRDTHQRAFELLEAFAAVPM